MIASLQVADKYHKKGMWRLWWVVAMMWRSLKFLFELSEFTANVHGGGSSSLRKALSSGIRSLTPFFVWIINSFINLFFFFPSQGEGSMDSDVRDIFFGPALQNFPPPMLTFMRQKEDNSESIKVGVDA